MALTELQAKLLKMLSWFHEYCQKNGLRYYAIGGTALGAARHQGFIPWDDDIDIGLPRPDYEKLKTLCKEEKGAYRFEFSGENKDFIYAYGKLYDSTTTLMENTRYKTKRGIYIDIFPLDGAGNTREESVAHLQAIDKKVNLLSTRTCAWRKGRKLYKNLAIVLMRLVPPCFFGAEKLKKEIETLSKSHAYDDCKYVANFVGMWHEKEITERAFFGTPTRCDFNGVTVMAPEKLDEFLTGVYGDWRTPPPPEKQVSHHDYILLDLEKSYLDDNDKE